MADNRDFENGNDSTLIPVDMYDGPGALANDGTAGTKSTTSKKSTGKSTNKATKPGAKTAATSKKKATSRTSKRPALQELSLNAADETDEVDELDFSDVEREEDQPAKAVTMPKVKAPTKKTAAKSKTIDTIPETQQQIPEVAVKSSRTAKKDVIPETQPEKMDVDESAEAGPTRKVPPTRRKAGSASDTDKPNHDGATRRELSDMTKKFESLDVKYQNLRDVGLHEAEKNFEKLRKQADDNAKAAETLINSLRGDLASYRNTAAETDLTRKEVVALLSNNKTLITERDAISSSLKDAQNEIKSLQAKLSATRSTSQDTNARIPANAAKSGTLLTGTMDMQKRQLKEDLYADLTGLMIRDIKRNEEEGQDVYDCIQTGRNGTLHFYLTVARPSANIAADDYENAEFEYMPSKDLHNDKELLAILPDYLIEAEGICFPRKQGAKFYARIVDCITRRIEAESQNGEGRN